MFFAWGCTVLDDRIQYVKVGDRIRITYEGETKNKRKQKVNLYKVEVAEKSGSKAEGNVGPHDNHEKIEIE